MFFIIFLLITDISLRVLFYPEKYLEPVEGKKRERLERSLDSIFQAEIVSIGFVISALAILHNVLTTFSSPLETVSSSVLLLFLGIILYPLFSKRRIGFLIQIRILAYSLFGIIWGLTEGLKALGISPNLMAGISAFAIIYIFSPVGTYIKKAIETVESRDDLDLSDVEEEEFSYLSEFYEEYRNVASSQIPQILDELGFKQVVENIDKESELEEGIEESIIKIIPVIPVIMLFLMLFMGGMFLLVNHTAGDYGAFYESEWEENVSGIVYEKDGDFYRINNTEKEYSELRKILLHSLQSGFEYSENLDEKCESAVVSGSAFHLMMENPIDYSYNYSKSDYFIFYRNPGVNSHRSCIYIPGRGYERSTGVWYKEVEPTIKELSYLDYSRLEGHHLKDKELRRIDRFS